MGDLEEYAGYQAVGTWFPEPVMGRKTQGEKNPKGERALQALGGLHLGHTLH